MARDGEKLPPDVLRVAQVGQGFTLCPALPKLARPSNMIRHDTLPVSGRSPFTVELGRVFGTHQEEVPEAMRLASSSIVQNPVAMPSRDWAAGAVHRLERTLAADLTMPKQRKPSGQRQVVAESLVVGDMTRASRLWMYLRTIFCEI